MNDTTTEIELKVHELMMNRSGGERVQMISDMFNAARTLVMASFPSGLTEIEVRSRLCERFYRDEVDVDAFIRAMRKI